MPIRCQFFAAVFALAQVSRLFALSTSALPNAANHLAAQPYATGSGIRIGIIDTAPVGIVPNAHLGARLKQQYDCQGLPANAIPPIISNPNDGHETLIANIAAGSDPIYPGVAPGADVYLAVADGTESVRGAINWLQSQHAAQVFNLSFGFDFNNNGNNIQALYCDWIIRERNLTLVYAAGNTGNYTTLPGDSYNGITVGAMWEVSQARASFSAYQIVNADPELRGTPDILAPGVDLFDGGVVYDNPLSGTSFSAPHVVGAAALLMDYGNVHPSSDTLDHRGVKALILNSARKRYITTPQILSPVSLDSAAQSGSFDRDYLQCASGCTIGNYNTAALTNNWTPAGWSNTGTALSVTKPLDDEQGVGFLDVTRAIINMAGGNAGPGPVVGIGWDQSTIATGDAPSLHTYSLHQTLAAGSFLTATLTWDRIVNELDGNGIVNEVDTYTFGELANLDLRILNGSNQVIAESVSTTGNIEHLHIPLPASGQPDDFKLQVVYNGGGVLATDYALAWWTDPTPIIPGDFNLDGAVNVADYQLWRANFGKTTAASPLIYGDGDANGVVDGADYIVWRDHLGQTWGGGASTPGTPGVPEPRGIILLLCAAGIQLYCGTRVRWFCTDH